MLEHGGRLRAAAARHDIPLADWIDLSTGINPHGWPVPPLPASVWQCLPEDDDGLEVAASAYYANPGVLPVAGSQAAIQWLPALLPRAVVTCLGPLYGEHPLAWQRAGHKLRLLPHAAFVRALAAATPYVVLCNPNNPTAGRHSREVLLAAADRLQQRGGWLVVDEAFIDATPEESVTPLAGTAAAPNLIALRSLGKFFGLAGARVGFLFANAELRARMAEAMGPWTLSGPAREVARRALLDADWQAATRTHLRQESRRLQDLLAPLGKVTATALFVTVETPAAASLHADLASQGILTRCFADDSLLRVGLPPNAAAWLRLADALAAAM
ncbi:MAG TPA: threonine-phosphate decarboxylase CobD [Accumulibacter sp.]|nr:threonine-phosphate decarboxylase CobD [Accumulibacter sp.]